MRKSMQASKSTEVTVLSLWQSASRVLARLGDAHTMVRPYHEETKVLPLLFSWRAAFDLLRRRI